MSHYFNLCFFTRQVFICLLGIFILCYEFPLTVLSSTQFLKMFFSLLIYSYFFLNTDPLFYGKYFL